jgi:hypothetical protein
LFLEIWVGTGEKWRKKVGGGAGVSIGRTFELEFNLRL